LKDLIVKEMGIQNSFILDERGIEITTMHQDDLIFSSQNLSPNQVN
jgi:hypothetical protein